MFDKVFTLKVDPLWVSCLDLLAKQSGRTRSDFVRDIIYLLTVDTTMADKVNDLFASEGVRYGS